MQVVIIDYGAGNIFSVEQAFKRLGIEPILTADPAVIKNATHVIFPGVGHAEAAMKQLKSSGLDKLIPTLTQPVLGICLGMQLMCKHTEEGNVDGLGIFDVGVKHFSKILDDENPNESAALEALAPDQTEIQIPHMGWNDVYFEDRTKAACYFVHSYFVPLCELTSSACQYPIFFSAGLQKDNFWGMQFHPEKSGAAGEKLIQQFLKQ